MGNKDNMNKPGQGGFNQPQKPQQGGFGQKPQQGGLGGQKPVDRNNINPNKGTQSPLNKGSWKDKNK